MRQGITSGRLFRLTTPSSTLQGLCCITEGSGSVAIRGLLKALAELYPRNTLSDMLIVFEESMSLREDADYGLIYSEHGAGDALEDAEVFFERSKMILHGSTSDNRPGIVKGEDLLSYLEKSKNSRRARSNRTLKRQARRPGQTP